MPKGFYIDPDIKFDITKLRSALKEVDSRVARQSPLGERDINAICLTQIPGDANSITGGNVRGLFWTKPDHTYEEVQREEPIDESKYSEFVKLFEDTYFKDVYNIEDPKIYNMKNILAKKKLTTKKSIDTITKKFLSRGEKRFTIV